MDQGGTTTMARTAGLAVDAAPKVRALVVAPLLLRLSLGAVFFAHGAQKLFGIFGGAGLSGTAAGFQAMGLKPALFMAILAGVLEFVGGIMLVVGLLTRPVAALIAIEMIFAMLAVHAPGGFFLNMACAPGKAHGIEFTLVLASSLAALSLLGPGRLSLDGSRPVRRKFGVFSGPLPRDRGKFSRPPPAP